MDMHNETTMASYEVRAETIGCKMVVGAKQMRKAVACGKARRVYLAQNADPAITQPIADACKRDHISCAWVRSMQDLGKACGIDVGAAAAAAVD